MAVSEGGITRPPADSRLTGVQVRIAACFPLMPQLLAIAIAVPLAAAR